MFPGPPGEGIVISPHWGFILGRDRPVLRLPLFQLGCRNPDARFSALQCPVGEHQASRGLPRVKMPALKGIHLAEMGTTEHS